jgi:hypothetical protein
VIIPAKTSLPSAFCRALGKGFAECQIRHSAKKSRRDGVWDRDGSLPSALGLALGKGPSLCRAPSVWRSAKAGSLPSVLSLALGKGWLFAECPQFGARHRLALCRVPVTWHSAKGRLCRASNRGRSAKFRSLCRVSVTWHSAKFRSLCRVFFLYTRQRVFLKILICFFRGILHKHIFTQAYYVFTQAYYLKFHIHNQIDASLIVTTKFNKVSSTHK